MRPAHLLSLLLALFIVGAPGASLAQAPNVNATLDDNVPAGTYKQNGQIIDYTIVIPNSGGDAAGVTLTDPTPANTTFVAGSLHASPLAFTDGPYSATGNTKLYVGTTPPGTEPARVVAGPSLLNNDTISTSPDTIVLTSGTFGTTLGGSVTINNDGSFTYTPPVGITGTDTFTYAIHNSADATLADTGTVSVTVTDVVWYVNNSGANGNGTSASPFSSLAGVSGAGGAGDSDQPNDFIYVYKGSATYTGGRLDLESGQVLTSESNPLIVGGITLRGAVPGNIPTLSNGAGTTVLLSTNNTIDGFNITGDSGIIGSNIGTATIADIGITATNNGLSVTGSGTLTVSGSANTLSARTALNVVNVNIGAGGLNFRSISASGGTSGIVLNNTGATAGLTVTGDGNTSVGGNNSGGTIQNTTSHGISLTNTLSPSFTNMNIHDTVGSGINGTRVTNFTFDNGTINVSGTGGTADDANISFNDNLNNGLANVTGTVTVTDSVLNHARYHGVDIQQDVGTLDNVVISRNSFTSDSSVTTSLGSAVRLINLGNSAATTVANVTKATLADNTIVNFNTGAGFVINGGNAQDTAGAPAGILGVAGSGTNVIAITGNHMNGGSLGVGNQPDRFITASVNGRGQGNFNISNNGTELIPITNIDGVVIELNAFGHTTLTSTIADNHIASNNAVGSAGINAGADADSLTTTTDDPFHTTTISGNFISQNDGVGMLVIARGVSTARVDAHILNNTVAAPDTTAAARAGIRVDSGSSGSINTTINLEISGNDTHGSTNSGTGSTSPGISLRKEGTNPNVNGFHIEGMGAGVTSTPGVENYVNSQNTSTSGTFGVGGTALLSATSGFSNGTPVGFLTFAPGGVELNPTARAEGAGQVDVASVASSAAATSQGTISTSAAPAHVLTQSELDSIVSAALVRWSAAGLTAEQLARLRSLRFEVSALGDLHLGEAFGNIIRIDRKAAGNGWFIDPTPMDDAEFANAAAGTRRYTDPSGAPAGRIDLLTTVMHEMGHRLGLGDAYRAQDRDGIMYGFLTKGERRLPAHRGH